MRDNEFGVSADFIEMPTKSAAGNAVALNMVTSDGLGYVEALPNRQAQTVQASIERGLAYFRRLSGGKKCTKRISFFVFIRTEIKVFLELFLSTRGHWRFHGYKPLRKDMILIPTLGSRLVMGNCLRWRRLFYLMPLVQDTRMNPCGMSR